MSEFDIFCKGGRHAQNISWLELKKMEFLY